MKNTFFNFLKIMFVAFIMLTQPSVLRAEDAPKKLRILSIEKIYQVDNDVYVYAEPSDSSKKIGQFYKDNSFTAMGKVEGMDWIVAMFAGQKGFIFAPSLQPAETAKVLEKEKAPEKTDLPAVEGKKVDVAPVEKKNASDEWAKIKDSLDLEELKTFINVYPESNYTAKANIRLKAIKRVQERKGQEKDSLENTLVMKLDNGGVVVIEMYPETAPKHVKRIKELVRQKFYNGLTFHRVIEDFMAQTGDPKGDGTGGSGKLLRAEFSDLKHERGTVSMARRPDFEDTADSQFFICYKAIPDLDGKYTIFGKVIYGMKAANRIKKGDKEKGIVKKPTKIQLMDVASDVFSRTPSEWKRQIKEDEEKRKKKEEAEQKRKNEHGMGHMPPPHEMGGHGMEPPPPPM